MARIRSITIALSLIAAASVVSLTDAAAQSSFSRCPKPEQQAEVMKLLVNATDRSKAMAEDNPLLLADVGFYETELAATKGCQPKIATATRPSR